MLLRAYAQAIGLSGKQGVADNIFPLPAPERGGKIPVQRFEDYCLNRASSDLGNSSPSFKGACAPANVRAVFPETIRSTSVLQKAFRTCGLENISSYHFSVKPFHTRSKPMMGVTPQPVCEQSSATLSTFW